MSLSDLDIMSCTSVVSFLSHIALSGIFSSCLLSYEDCTQSQSYSAPRYRKNTLKFSLVSHGLLNSNFHRSFLLKWLPIPKNTKTTSAELGYNLVLRLGELPMCDQREPGGRLHATQDPSYSPSLYMYRCRLKCLYVVARSLLLLSLTWSACACLGPAQQDLHAFQPISVQKCRRELEQSAWRQWIKGRAQGRALMNEGI